MSENDQKMTKKKAKKKVKSSKGTVVVHNITAHNIHTGIRGKEKILPGKCVDIPEEIAELLAKLEMVEIVEGLDQ